MEIKITKFFIVLFLLFFMFNVFSYSYPNKTRNYLLDFSLKETIKDSYLSLRGKVSKFMETIEVLITGDLPSRRLAKGD